MSVTTGNSPATTNQVPIQTPIGNIQGLFAMQLTLTPVAVATITTAEQSFTVTGLLAGDLVSVNMDVAQAGLGIAGARAAANTLYITYVNPTAGSITPTAAAVYHLVVMRPMASALIDGLPSTLPLN